MKNKLRSILKSKNWLYWIQSKYRKFISDEQLRISGVDTPQSFAVKCLERAEKCNGCFLNGECIECGCSFVDMVVYSDKPCPKKK